MDSFSKQVKTSHLTNSLDLLSPFPHCTDCIHKIRPGQQILDVDEKGEAIVDCHGHKKYRNFKIGILGAGVAGLNAALYFRRLNKHFDFKIDYEVIEGDSRVGGRILTHFYEKTFDWQYSDMGAMRLPKQHSPTYDLISYVNSELEELNKTAKKPYPLIELITYFFDSRDARFSKDPNNKDALNSSIYYSRDRDAKFQLKDLVKTDLCDEDLLRLDPRDLQYLRIAREANKAYSEAMDPITKEFVEAIRDSLLEIEPKLETGSADEKIDELENYLYHNNKLNPAGNSKFYLLMKKYGDLTLFQYLDKTLKRLGYIEKKERRQVMENWENIFGYVGNLQISLVEQVFEDKDFSSLFDPDLADPDPSSGSSDNKNVSIWPRGPIQYIDNPDKKNEPFWKTISGGLQTLTDAMYKLIGKDKVKLNNRIVKIENFEYKHHNDETPLPRVKVHYSNGKSDWFDRIIVTLPTSALANIDWNGFNHFQDYLKAFRNLNADPLFKHSVQFSHRFWEDLNLVKPGWAVIGGQSYTDTGSRNLVFPCYGFEEGPSYAGTVLSYNFLQDGVRMLGLTEEERTQRVLSDLQALMDVVAIKPFNVRDYYTGNSYSQSWMNSPSNGLAYFRPGQYKLLRPLALGFEDRILFAGEHLSVHHGWIVGSLQSSNRAIMKMCQADVKFLVDEDKYEKYALPLEGLIKHT